MEEKKRALIRDHVTDIIHDDVHVDVNKGDVVDGVEIVQGFDYWMDGFWLVVGGYFRQRYMIEQDQYTFTETGCQCITPDTPFPVQKCWYFMSQPTDPTKFNRASVSWVGGSLVIQASIEEAPCTIKWFNLY